MNQEVTNKDIYDAINDFRNEVKCSYVTNDRFNPVEKLVYGLVGIVMVAVFGALVALVINKTGVNARW